MEFGNRGLFNPYDKGIMGSEGEKLKLEKFTF